MVAPMIQKALIPLATFAGLAFVFWTPWVSLLKEWGRDEYSHGYILPFLALLMVWHKLAGQKRPSSPSWLGFMWVLGGLALLLVSEISTLRQLSYYAMLLCLVGLSLSYFGRVITKEIIPAFVLLLFAIPLPYFLFNNFSLYLQLISSSLGVTLLEVIGISVHLDGNIIDLGSQKLQVVEACNGLRYLFPLTSLSFLLAYLLKDRWWKRIFLFASAIPLGIGMNAVRIAFVGILADVWGIEATEDFSHFFEGFVVFLICLLVIMLEVRILQRIGTPGSFMWDFFGIPEKRLFIRPSFNSKQATAVLVLSLGMTSLVASGLTQSSPTPKSLSAPLSVYPMSIDGWQGKQGVIEDNILRALALTDYIIADFSHTEKKAPINFYIAYYGKQELLSSIHSPSTCLPGGGWVIESATNISIPVTSKTGNMLTLSRLVIKQGTAKQIIYYWFDQRGRIITSQIAAKWYLLVDGLSMHRSDGALVRFVTAVLPTETEADADQRLASFVASSYPIVRGYLQTK